MRSHTGAHIVEQRRQPSAGSSRDSQSTFTSHPCEGAHTPTLCLSRHASRLSICPKAARQAKGPGFQSSAARHHHARASSDDSSMYFDTSHEFVECVKLV